MVYLWNLLRKYRLLAYRFWQVFAVWISICFISHNTFFRIDKTKQH